MRWGWRTALVAMIVTSAREAGAQAPPQRPGVTVVLTGDAPARARVAAAMRRMADLPVDLRFSDPPNVPPTEPTFGDVDARLSGARKAYVAADFARCLQGLSDEPLVVELLASGRRVSAARVLFWRAACQVGAGELSAATRAASSLATFGLETPADVEAATPEVEALLAKARRAANDAKAIQTQVSADVGRAVVSVDGTPGVCVTPCTLELRPGDHVIRLDADGASPETRLVRTEGTTVTVAARMSPASPELAARQWTSRYASTLVVDSSASVKLLARAVRARRLALVAIDTGRGSVRLRGVLATEGAVAGRAERPNVSDRDLDDETSALVRELLVRGNVLEPAPSLVERPLFWVVVGLVAASAAATTALLLYEPPTRTEVAF